MTRKIQRHLITIVSSSGDFPYAIVIGACMGLVAVIFIVLGLYFYCKERKRNKELEREPYVTLAPNSFSNPLSPRIATITSHTSAHNSSNVQLPSVHSSFYVMTSPGNSSALVSVEVTPTGHYISSSRLEQQSTPVMALKDQKLDGQSYLRSYEDTVDLNSFDASARSRVNSFEDHESYRRAMGYNDSARSSAQTTNSNSNHNDSSTRHRGLWEDPAIVAARIPMSRITIGDVISRGGFGEVLRGLYKNRDVAIKRLLPETRKDLSKIEEFLVEVKLQAALEHERVVRFVGVAWDSLTDLCVVSEFMDGGDLRALLVKFDEVDHRSLGFDAVKARIVLDMAHALTYLHCLDPTVLHRDLKSRNILLDKTLRAKLTDFGVSRERSDRTMTAGVGTSLWMAPEVMMGERYDEKADIFSFGVVLSELDSHKLPYACAKVTDTGRVIPDTAILQLISSGRLSVGFTAPTSPALEAMVHLGTACVAFEPEERPTASQALYQMQLVMQAFAQEEAETSYAF
ncbi:unnamed protein product [Peronospora farinosa]|uniref:Protein kinase domain-containing protein n=1 Tax=Peronospora farinosa TaxID=134698 RepID=A0AAV0UPX4_9STRA|nr:unnamed protein product [Peronospora farinosa]CAI5738914.1 unnamed protein product [Peronospora farinosa]